MSRPDREELLMATAHLWARRSTCDRLSVGAVIHREGRILVQGYNGAPAGLPHCNHECSCLTHRGKAGDLEHESWCNSQPLNCRAVHAEQNAISWAARYGVGLDNSQMVVTHQPCLSCARSIINAGINMVTYNLPYRLTEGLELLSQAKISIRRSVVDYSSTPLI